MKGYPMTENVETKVIPAETIQNCIEALEQALEDQVEHHCNTYICDGYINMTPQERWKKWGLSFTYNAWQLLSKYQ